MGEDINAKVQASRKELLDIGLRNQLVSFRKTSKSLALRTEDPLAVFDAAVLDERALRFEALGAAPDEAPRTDSAENAGGASDDELLQALSPPGAPAPARGRAAERRSSLGLKAHLDPERLFLQLLKMQAEAQGYVDEQGVNILFLAFGFLHWFETPSATEARRAPLLLVPMRLERAGAQDPFSLRHTGEELFVNLSLQAKLRTDFATTLPLLDLEGEVDGAALQAYFDEVQQAVSGLPRWRVAADELVLGFFSFGKFLMFKDLDPASWPEGKGPADHPVVSRLLGEGFGDQPPRYADDQSIDAIIDPGEVRFVRDADSSQTQAILEARAGSHLIIQGPPGTGKSQTITNLVAELIGQGKTVLFVSEKMAALEVVKRRLDESHLGDAVLELHSQRATKSEVLAELSRTMTQGQPLNDTGERDIAELRRMQAQLNAYCEAVGAPVGVSQVPFGTALGRHLQLQRLHPDAPPLAVDAMAGWTERDYLDRRERVGELVAHVAATGRPDRNRFWGTRRDFFTPIEQANATQALQAARRLLDGFRAASEALSGRLMLPQPATLLDIDVVCRAARRAAGAPRLQGVQLSTQDWQLRRDALRELFGAGRRMAALQAQHGPNLLELAWTQDLLPIRQALMAHGQKWWRFLSGPFKQAKAQLQALMTGPVPKATRDMLALVDAVIEHQGAHRRYAQHEALGAALFGAQWQRQQSDWDVLERITDWVMQLHDELGRGEIPGGILAFLSGGNDAGGLGEQAGRIEAALAQMKTHLDTAVAVTGMGAAQPLDLRAAAIDELARTLDGWSQDIGQLYPMVRFNALAAQLKAEGLEAVVAVAAQADDASLILPAYDQAWYAGLVQQAYARHPVLQQFDRVQHEHLIQRFRALDLGSMQHAQAQLASQVWQNKPALNQPGEMAILRAEMNKKRRHLPIRQLIDRAGRALQKIKPVFMMSPMSIANFLPPGKVEFDVVIFDEASQVKAVDALGAIMRGKQVIVVGDTRQMPPTDFFSREIDLDDEHNETSDIESILSLFKAAGCHECYLRWHYRSQHESLIAVSNAEFYDNKLVIFPSAGNHPDATGVQLQHLPQALYDRGRTRTNRDEAKAVAAAVMRHALEQPHLSLGVAAFSVAQRDLIAVEVEMLRRQQPAGEAFFSAHPSEPFFVKNLENIQGDERDAIFISVGYGRNETGRVAKEFGPLNRDGGHRRLNVLITRAKMQMRVFSNFTADELDLDASAKHGVRALKNFLKYAQHGELEVAQSTGKATDSPFEDEVLEALRDLDYPVEPQVGTAGYFIDMAVKDPDRPGRYLLAIECDGASYHSSRSARDRDRLRQGVLEGLGWRFHRIWSTDWFRNRRQEIARMVEAIERARALPHGRPATATTVPTAPDEPYVIVRGEPAPEEVSGLSTPYRKARLAPQHSVALLDADMDLLAGLMADAVGQEGPMHVAELNKRLMEAFGTGRAGSRIVAHLQAALDHGRRRRQLRVHGDFVHLHGTDRVPVRDRSGLEPAERKIEWVPPEEIDEALLASVRIGFSMPIDEAVPSALSLLGFGRATQRMAAVVQERLEALTGAGRLTQHGDILRVDL